MTPGAVGFVCPDHVATGSQEIRASALLNRRPPFTTAVIAILVVIYVVQVATDASASFSLTSSWLLYGPYVADGEWWRIITSGFLHGSIMHLGFNCYALWVLGSMLERAIGSWRLALCYGGSLLGGAAAVMAFNFDSPTIGASGAVLGLAGAIAGGLRGNWRAIQRSGIAAMLAINLALPLLIPRISFWGHLGGMAAGFTLGMLVGRPARLDGEGARGREAAAVVVSLVWGAAAVALAVAQPLG